MPWDAKSWNAKQLFSKSVEEKNEQNILITKTLVHVTSGLEAGRTCLAHTTCCVAVLQDDCCWPLSEAGYWFGWIFVLICEGILMLLPWCLKELCCFFVLSLTWSKHQFLLGSECEQKGTSLSDLSFGLLFPDFWNFLQNFSSLELC